METEHAGPCPTTLKVLKTNEHEVKDVQVVSSCVVLGGGLCLKQQNDSLKDRQTPVRLKP